LRGHALGLLECGDRAVQVALALEQLGPGEIQGLGSRLQRSRLFQSLLRRGEVALLGERTAQPGPQLDLVVGAR
jgi:hypothetical protein